MDRFTDRLIDKIIWKDGFNHMIAKRSLKLSQTNRFHKHCLSAQWGNRKFCFLWLSANGVSKFCSNIWLLVEVLGGINLLMRSIIPVFMRILQKSHVFPLIPFSCVDFKLGGCRSGHAGLGHQKVSNYLLFRWINNCFWPPRRRRRAAVQKALCSD